MSATTAASRCAMPAMCWRRTRSPAVALRRCSCCFVLAAVLGPCIAPYDPLASDTAARAASRRRAAHWFGTDQLGRDIFSRVMVATRLDLGIACASVALSFWRRRAAPASPPGYFGGWTDRIVGRVVDTIMAFPLFVLAMGIVAALGNTVPTSSTPPRSSTCRSMPASRAPRRTCGARPASSRRRGCAGNGEVRTCCCCMSCRTSCR